MQSYRLANFHDYLIEVYNYYHTNQSLRGFSRLAKRYETKGITTELFYSYGLDKMVTPPSRELSDKIRLQMAGEVTVPKENSICTYADFATFSEVLYTCNVKEAAYQNHGIIALPKLTHGMLVLIKTSEDNWVMDWFDYAIMSKSGHPHYVCVCDGYTDCTIVPLTPESRNIFFSEPLNPLYIAWHKRTRMEVIDYLKEHEEYR